jgi:hypothetical protein
VFYYCKDFAETRTLDDSKTATRDRCNQDTKGKKKKEAHFIPVLKDRVFLRQWIKIDLKKERLWKGLTIGRVLISCRYIVSSE